MLHLAFIVLLFNLTYTIIPVFTEDSVELAGFGVEGKPPINNAQQNTNNKKELNEAKPAGAILGVPKDPFAEKAGKDESKPVKSKNEHQDIKQENAAQIEQNKKLSNPEQVVNKDVGKKEEKPKDSPKPVGNKDSTSDNKDYTAPIPILPNPKQDIVQSGALLRGFYVFLGLSVITMVYFIFRSYRLRRGSQPSTTVRKYGVTARRSDMEMRPLELEDEDDDTLFDIGNPGVNR